MKRILPVAILIPVLALMLTGCWQIWNASDLIKWVKRQAENAGCTPGSIKLEDWYVEQGGENVWPGTCTNKVSGEPMSFAIGIDAVWQPSVPPEAVPDAAKEGEAVVTDALTADELANAIYSGIYDEPVTLVDGVYEGEPFVAGDASRPVVAYEAGAEHYGDLDGDGVDDAVVFLVESAGGSGSFVYVAAQLNRDGAPVDAGAVLIEDRIQVESVSIADGQVALGLIVPGPGDGACCPSHKSRATYGLQDGPLAELSRTEVTDERVSAADLDGTRWVLTELGAGQLAVDGTEITVQFAGDQLSGTGGCNQYSGTFTLGADNPFVMTLSPLAVTAMACPDPIAAQESAYFAALQDVSLWGYYYGELALAYLGDDGTPDRLLFAPAAPEAAQVGDALTAHSWQWVSFTSPVEQVEIANPEQYQVTFGEDGSLAILADCNRAAGSYTAATGGLQVMVGPMTMAACAPDSRSDQFVVYLGSAARYFFQDGQLLIDLFADGGTLVFAPAP